MKQQVKWALLLWAGGFLIGFAVAITGSGETLYLTDNISIIPAKQPWIFAGLFGLFIVVLRLVVLLTVRICFRILASRYAMLIFGSFIFLFGAGGLALVLTHLPEEGAGKVAHVIGVTVFFALLGLLMIWTGRHGWRNNTGRPAKKRRSL